MTLLTMFRLLQIKKIIPMDKSIQANNYAGHGLTSGKSKKNNTSYSVQKIKIIPVEKDVNKLLKFCCGTNILKNGQDVELKPDSEYPEWLWNIRTKRAKQIQHLDPNTKEYWKKHRKLALQRQAKLNIFK